MYQVFRLKIAYVFLVPDVRANPTTSTPDMPLCNSESRTPNPNTSLLPDLLNHSPQICAPRVNVTNYEVSADITAHRKFKNVRIRTKRGIHVIVKKHILGAVNCRFVEVGMIDVVACAAVASTRRQDPRS